jgi:hypothetical protein
MPTKERIDEFVALAAAEPGMLFTRCAVCNGTLHLVVGEQQFADACPCTRSSTPGWSPTGFTDAQAVEARKTLNRLIRGERDEALTLLYDLRKAHQKQQAEAK